MWNFVREKEIHLEGTLSREKMANIWLYGKIHEKADLTERIGYEYYVMKLLGNDENKRSLTDIALWWKNYNIHVIEEIRQLRGGVSFGIKNIIKGWYFIELDNFNIFRN